MDDENVIARRDRAACALVAEDASARLGAVLAIGSDPDPALATSPPNQARVQALHTLSKIADERAWSWITAAMLRDPDDEVARTAWRAAVALAPPDDVTRTELARVLVGQLGRGDRPVRRSLSRALVDLGEAAEPSLRRCAAGTDATAAHARATRILLADPETGFDAAMAEAERLTSLGADPGAAAGAGSPDLVDGTDRR